MPGRSSQEQPAAGRGRSRERVPGKRRRSRSRSSTHSGRPHSRSHGRSEARKQRKAKEAKVARSSKAKEGSKGGRDKGEGKGSKKKHKGKERDKQKGKKKGSKKKHSRSSSNDGSRGRDRGKGRKRGSSSSRSSSRGRGGSRGRSRSASRDDKQHVAAAAAAATARAAAAVAAAGTDTPFAREFHAVARQLYPLVHRAMLLFLELRPAFCAALTAGNLEQLQALGPRTGLLAVCQMLREDGSSVPQQAPPRRFAQVCEVIGRDFYVQPKVDPLLWEQVAAGDMQPGVPAFVGVWQPPKAEVKRWLEVRQVLQPGATGPTCNGDMCMCCGACVVSHWRHCGVEHVYAWDMQPDSDVM